MQCLLELEMSKAEAQIEAYVYPSKTLQNITYRLKIALTGFWSYFQNNFA